MTVENDTTKTEETAAELAQPSIPTTTESAGSSIVTELPTMVVVERAKPVIDWQSVRAICALVSRAKVPAIHSDQGLVYFFSPSASDDIATDFSGCDFQEASTGGVIMLRVDRGPSDIKVVVHPLVLAASQVYEEIERRRALRDSGAQGVSDLSEISFTLLPVVERQNNGQQALRSGMPNIFEQDLDSVNLAGSILLHESDLITFEKTMPFVIANIRKMQYVLATNINNHLRKEIAVANSEGEKALVACVANLVNALERHWPLNQPESDERTVLSPIVQKSIVHESLIYALGLNGIYHGVFKEMTDISKYLHDWNEEKRVIYSIILVLTLFSASALGFWSVDRLTHNDEPLKSTINLIASAVLCMLAGIVHEKRARSLDIVVNNMSYSAVEELRDKLTSICSKLVA